MFHLILQLHHFVYLGNIRRSWYSEISPRIPFNPLPFFLSQVHRLRALSPFLLLLLLFVFFFALSLSYQSTMAFHARSAISFLVRVLVHEIERDRKRQWLVVVIFERTGSIRGSHCSRGPSLAVILGVSRSNKSQVELRGRLPIRLDSVIHPYRLRNGLDKRPASRSTSWIVHSRPSSIVVSTCYIFVMSFISSYDRIRY